jgi:hypothetical protein
MRIMKKALTALALAITQLMTGCAVSGSGTENGLVFDAQQSDSVAAHKASWSESNGDVLSIEFNCPGQVHSLMMSIIVPLPPIIPVKSEDDNHFLAMVSMPKTWPKSEQPFSITLANGQTLPWPAEDEPNQLSDGKQNLTHFYKFKLHCKMLDGATVKYISPTTTTTTTTTTVPQHTEVVHRLTFTSKKYTDFGYMRS